MKLADYLYENGMTPTHIRRLLGIKHRSTFLRWLTGDRVPSKAMCDRISLFTNGHVRRTDFLDPSPPKCAVIVMEPGTDDVVVIHPWSPRYEAIKARQNGLDGDSPNLSPSVLRALRVLKGRAWYTPTGRFTLDGRLVDLKRIMLEANDVLEKRGEPPIPYPSVRPIHE